MSIGDGDNARIEFWREAYVKEFKHWAKCFSSHAAVNSELSQLEIKCEHLKSALREAFHLLDDLAKLEVGHSDGSDMYTCTMSADEYLERVNGLHEKATALLGESK